MSYSKTTLVVLLLCLFVAGSVAQQKVKIVGVWQSLSQKMDGKEVLTSGKDVKYITAKHWIWIYLDKEKLVSLLAKKTQRDSISAYYDAFGAGAGTYTLVGNIYTETVEYNPEPNYIGLSFPFTMKVEGHEYSPGWSDVRELKDTASSPKCGLVRLNLRSSSHSVTHPPKLSAGKAGNFHKESEKSTGIVFVPISRKSMIAIFRTASGKGGR